MEVRGFPLEDNLWLCISHDIVLLWWGWTEREDVCTKKKAVFCAAKIRKDTLFYCPHSPTKQIFSIYTQFRCLSRSKSRGLVLCGSIDKRGERFGKGTKVLSRLRDQKKFISVLEVSEASALALNQLGLRRQCWSPWLPLMGNEGQGRPPFALSFCSTCFICLCCVNYDGPVIICLYK